MAIGNHRKRRFGMQKLTRRTTTRRVMFHKRAEPGSQVFLAGDFNGWSTTDYPMVDREGNGMFSCSVELQPGIYQYKFVVDGIWCLDESNPEFVVSDLGTFNNIVEVKPYKE